MERRRIVGYNQIWKFLIDAYGARCVYCHKNIFTQIDHVIPVSYIKYDGIENLRPCCAWCNLTASDKVFNDFDEKYEFIRSEINRQKKRQHQLNCVKCLLPYYSALQGNFIFCPRCYAVEFDTTYLNNKAWQEWLHTLTNAGIIFRANFSLADTIDTLDYNLSLSDEIDVLVEYHNLNSPYFDELQLRKELVNHI